MAIGVLGRFLGVLDDQDLINALIRDSEYKKTPEIQAKALNAISNVIDRSPELRALDANRKRRLKNLIHPCSAPISSTRNVPK